jgi:hypothetical protein
MPIEVTAGGTMVTGKGIGLYRLLAMRSALGLQLKTGMKLSRGLSAYSMAKREFGLKGNIQRVYEQLDAIVNKASAEYAGD